MKTRIIKTRFWEDDDVQKVSKNSRYLWIFLLTNKNLGMTNYLHMPDPLIVYFTGLTQQELVKAKQELERTTKARFYNGWIYIKNLEKNNNYRFSSNNEKTYTNELNEVPKEVKDHFSKDIDSTIHSTIDSTIDSTINSSHKSKVINNNNKIINNKYTEFINLFNALKKTKFGYKDTKAQKQFENLICDGITFEQIEHAINNAKNDKFLKENPKYLTPEYITRPSIFDKWLNATPYFQKTDGPENYDVL